MGFADYFLIVWDFIHFAKQNGVSVGPGPRLGGRLARRVLPRDHGRRPDALRPPLRALPEPGAQGPAGHGHRLLGRRPRPRHQLRRREVRPRPRRADHHLLDDGRARGHPRRRAACSTSRTASSTASRSSSPKGPGQTLEAALKPGAELRQAVDSDPVAKEIVDLARPLEGLTRADSIHAAGVVIGAQPLIEVVPLQQKGADQEIVTQLGMCDVVDLGLLKMDFLGLRNLDVIDKAVELVGGVDIGTLPLDDAKTYAMLARGDSTGVFQFESSGMREALRR